MSAADERPLIAHVVFRFDYGGLENGVVNVINGLPEALSPVMRWVQWLGVLAVGPIVALGAALFRRWRLAIACLLVVALLAGCADTASTPTAGTALPASPSAELPSTSPATSSPTIPTSSPTPSATPTTMTMKYVSPVGKASRL